MHLCHPTKITIQFYLFNDELPFPFSTKELEVKTVDVLEFRNLYWNYYIQLENDFFSYSPYCEIDQCNDNAFSVKYLQLLLSVCGEIDSICKTFCKALDNDFDPDTAGIDNYISILREEYPTFATEKVKIIGYKYREMQPWKSIAYGYAPNWWHNYNAIKHHRDQEQNGKANYKYANQKNVIDALCALYVLLEYWAAKNFVIGRDEAIKQLNANPNEHTMYSLKSRHLNLTNWTFYETYMGQYPWFNPRRFYLYLEGVKPL